ncbi:hypothetical protein KOI35_37040 [Actinoplanes bogorensis]|uniref:Pyridoxamine 5'-phosphate oxidase n=1 Tax=Paractinoplanes bogorensis TaxID=1610840 RepID=A0ABS5Z0B4_9ACTN|nr:hypothetical protein [Actinoplanes bogorensis]MBU2669134.1 hypothetical protein [Actinoplanes bogorensis]
MTDLREFRRACHKAAGRVRATVTGFRVSDGVTPNFHQGILAFRDRTEIAVVLARDTGVAALAEPRVISFAEATALESGPLTFVDHPELTVALVETRAFRVMTTAELADPFDAREWPQLTEYDVRFWKPETLGDALFNYWD